MSTKNSQQIHNFWMVGVNYKRTDAAVRGLYAINAEQYDRLLTLAPQYNIKDIFIISTCNRTEVYSFAENAKQLMELVCSVTVGEVDTLSNVVYIKNELEAVEHFFNVAAGLDSQILGDFEILGQIKNSVKYAKNRGFIGCVMERIINSVYRSAKSIKTNTNLSCGTVSVSFAAIQYIREHFTDVNSKKIILIGTGKIGRTTCKNLVDYLGATNITLLNRTEETAICLAKELQLKAVPFSDLENEISTADIILVSTGALEPIILKEHLEGKGEKLIIDLSVPCNVSIEVKTLSSITLADVDLLSKIKDETLAKRKEEVPKAVALIKEHIAEFMEWYNMRRYIPVLNEVKDKLRDIYIEHALRDIDNIPVDEVQEETINKVINSFAAKMRRKNTVGCYYIEAINDYIESNA